MAEAAIDQEAAEPSQKAVPGTLYIHVPVDFLTKVFNGEIMSRAMDWTNAPPDVEVVAVEQSIRDRNFGLCKIFLQSKVFPALTKYERNIPKGGGYQYGTMKDLEKNDGQLPQGGRWLRRVVVPGK